MLMMIVKLSRLICSLQILCLMTRQLPISFAKISESANVDGPNVNADKEPEFDAPIKNITVPLGREAVLSCSVTDLGNYKVGWMKAEDQTILTLHNKVVTHNGRVSVVHDSQRIWQLRIRQVRESDKGCYMCQINTNVMKKQLGCIDVHIPPDISDQMTVSDVSVNEGENATLVCKAVGHPQPRIIWRREDGGNIVLKKAPRETVAVETYSGDTLQLTKLKREEMGSYMCIASNDVPPAVSKRITLHVNFAPVIRTPNQLVGAPLGTDVELQCFVEAFPNTVNYWMKKSDNRILQGGKFKSEEIKNSSYQMQLKLTLKSLTDSDLGAYMCVATNSFGKAEWTIRVYEIKIPTTTTTTTTTTSATPSTVITRDPITTTNTYRSTSYYSGGLDNAQIISQTLDANENRKYRKMILADNDQDGVQTKSLTDPANSRKVSKGQRRLRNGKDGLKSRRLTVLFSFSLSLLLTYYHAAAQNVIITFKPFSLFV